MTVLNIVTSCLCIITIAVIFIFTKWMHELLSDTEQTEIEVKLFKNGKLPEYKRAGDACLDCKASEAVVVKAGERALVPLGFAIGLPENYEAIVRPRSGNTKDGIDIGIGTIDETYRGEVKACVINNSDKDFLVEIGDRICQLAIREAPKFSLVSVYNLNKTERGENGFGSSGLK